MNICSYLARLIDEKKLSGVKDGSIFLSGGSDNSRYRVELTGIESENVAVINFGKSSHSSVIKKGCGYDRVCDYLILVPKADNKAIALLCELKSTFKGKGEGEKQLQASMPLVEYIKSMIYIHFNTKYQIVYKFAIISNKIVARLDKQSVRPEPKKPKIKIGNSKKLTCNVIIGAMIPLRKIVT